MLYFTLCFTVYSVIHPDFSFQPPIIQSNVSEIGVWALRGSAVNMKKFIRLTSLLTNDYGGLCSYQRTLSNDWQIDFQFSLQINSISLSDNFNQNIKKNSIFISFTKELCPESTLSWSGFKFVINITSHLIENKLQLAFSMQTNDGTLVGFSNNHDIKSIPIFLIKNEYFYTIRITKAKSDFTFYISNNSKEFERIHSIKTNMTTGYFSLLNQISEDQPLRKSKKSRIEILNGLQSIKIEQKITHEINETETKHNRKYLSSGSISRSFSKQKRKSLMQKVNYYKEEMEFNGGKLNAKEADEDEDDTENQSKLKDSFIEISEMIKRADQDLTLDDLQLFINSILDVRLNTALSKIEKISADLNDLKLDLIHTWNNVKNQLLDISISIHSNFDVIENETAKSVLLYLNNNNNNKVKIKIPNDLEKDAIIKFLFIVCLFEFIGFVAFFLIKRKATNNFKKID